MNDKPVAQNPQLDLYVGDDIAASQGLGARKVTLDLIDAVLRHKRTLDDAMESSKEMAALEPRDRAFSRLLAATILRRLGQVDALAAHALDRPLDRVTPRKVLDILRLGIAQLVFLGTPAHAAVDTSVRIASELGMDKQKGLVNAVLRNVSRSGAEVLESQDAARMNTPDWLWYSWVKQYGVQQTLDIARANLNEAPLDITVKDSLDEWANQLDAQILPTGTLRRETGGLITDLPGFDEGAWWVQDASAAIPARLLGDVKGKTVVDLCAAPGGKSAQLAAQGANVIALDRAARRMKILEENFKRLDLLVTCEVADASIWQPSEPVDAVLVDAPCTATGTIRRHPDILHLKQPEDMSTLCAVQSKLLKNAVNMLRPGGVLVYCTCSLQFEEGEEQIAAILNSGVPLERLPVSEGEVGGIDTMINENGELRILPTHLSPYGGMDGFFIARLRKTA